MSEKINHYVGQWRNFHWGWGDMSASLLHFQDDFLTKIYLNNPLLSRHHSPDERSEMISKSPSLIISQSSSKCFADFISLGFVSRATYRLVKVVGAVCSLRGIPDDTEG